MKLQTIEILNVRHEQRGARTRKVCDIICPRCGQTRTVRYHNLRLMKTLLCRQCSAKVVNPKRTTGSFQSCHHCGKSMWVIPALANHKKYCSKQCEILARKGTQPEWLRGKGGREPTVPRIIKKCPVCNKQFVCKQQPANRKEQVFCSQQCHAKSRLQRIRKVCQSCHKEFEVTPSRINAQYCSMDCYDKSGKKNPNFKNGDYIDRDVPPFPYGGSWSTLREAIKKRDNHTCQWPDCNSREKLTVHHIVKVQDFETLEEANDESNLITLCLYHHQAVHYNRLDSSWLEKRSNSLPGLIPL